MSSGTSRERGRLQTWLMRHTWRTYVSLSKTDVSGRSLTGAVSLVIFWIGCAVTGWFIWYLPTALFITVACATVANISLRLWLHRGKPVTSSYQAWVWFMAAQLGLLCLRALFLPKVWAVVFCALCIGLASPAILQVIPAKPDDSENARQLQPPRLGIGNRTRSISRHATERTEGDEDTPPIGASKL